MMTSRHVWKPTFQFSQVRASIFCWYKHPATMTGLCSRYVETLHMISLPEMEHEAMRHMLGQPDCQLDYWCSSLALAAGGLQPAASGYAHKQGCAIKCDRQTGLDSVYGATHVESQATLKI